MGRAITRARRGSLPITVVTRMSAIAVGVGYLNDACSPRCLDSGITRRCRGDWNGRGPFRSRYHDWRQLGRSKPTASYGCLVRQPADRGHDWSTIRHSPSPGGHARPPPAHACTARRLRSRHPPRLRRRATAKRLSRKHLSTARPRTHMSSSHQIAPPNDMQGSGSTPHHIAFPPPVTCVEHRGAQWQCLQACASLCQQQPLFSFSFCFLFFVAPPSFVLRHS